MKPPKRKGMDVFDDPAPGQIQPGRAYKGEPASELPPAPTKPVEIIPAGITSQGGINSTEEFSRDEAAAILKEIEKHAPVAEDPAIERKRAMWDPEWNGVRIGHVFPKRNPVVGVTDLQTIASVQVVFFVRFADDSRTTLRLPLDDFRRKYP